jgi:hypothetical protein
MSTWNNNEGINTNDISATELNILGTFSNPTGPWTATDLTSSNKLFLSSLGGSYVDPITN